MTDPNNEPSVGRVMSEQAERDAYADLGRKVEAAVKTYEHPLTHPDDRQMAVGRAVCKLVAAHHAAQAASGGGEGERDE